MILGTNSLTKTGIQLEYGIGYMQWYDSTLPMHPCRVLTSHNFDNTEDMYHNQFEDELGPRLA